MFFQKITHYLISIKYSVVTIVLIYLLSVDINADVTINLYNGSFKNTADSVTQKVKPKKIKKRRSVYKLQSISVAVSLKLSQEQADSLEVIYRESRKRRKAELSKFMDKQSEEYKTKAAQIEKDERDNLYNNIKLIMTEEQAEKAIIPLGGFNPRWDSYVAVIANLELNKETKYLAVQSTLNYATEYEQGKRDGNKGSRNQRNSKSKLDESLRRILTDKQFDEWNLGTNKSKNN